MVSCNDNNGNTEEYALHGLSTDTNTAIMRRSTLRKL
jgi:hypothetical protein